MLEDLDAKSIDMLRAIAEHDDAATTSEIRNVTGLTNSQVAYRRNKLDDYGLISVRTGDSNGSRTPPKVHVLTPTARSHVESGLFERYNAPVTSDVEQLSTQVNHLHDRVDDLAEEISELEECIENVNAALNARVGTPVEWSEATDGEQLVSVVSSLEAEVAELRAEVDELDERKKDKFTVFK